MKKLLVVLLAVCMIACFAACSDKPAESSAPAEESKPVEESKPAEESKIEESSEEESVAESSEEVSVEPEPVSGPKRDISELVLVSKDSPYTGAVNTRADSWDDNGLKLTDGVIPGANGGTTDYFGFNAPTAEIVVDLGTKVEDIVQFCTFATSGNWGISQLISVTYFISDDGENWTKVGRANGFEQEPVAEDPTADGTWAQVDFAFAPEEPVAAQYVKFSIMSPGHAWIGELGVYTE